MTPSGTKGSVTSSAASAVSSANTAATTKNSKRTQSRPANTNVAPSAVQYKTSVGVPISTFLALKNAAVNASMTSTRAAVSTYTTSANSMKNPVKVVPKNDKTVEAANRLLSSTATAPVGSKSDVSDVTLTTTGASFTCESNTGVSKDCVPDPKYSVPTGSDTKENKDDVYVVLGDDKEGSTTLGGLKVGCGGANSSESKGTVQSCVTVGDGEVIVVLDDNDSSPQSTANTGGKLSAVNKQQSAPIDTGIAVSSQIDNSELPSSANVGKQLSDGDETQPLCMSSQSTKNHEVANKQRTTVGVMDSMVPDEDDTTADITVVENDDDPVLFIKTFECESNQIRGETGTTNRDLNTRGSPVQDDVDSLMSKKSDQENRAFAKAHWGLCGNKVPEQNTDRNAKDTTMEIDADPQDNVPDVFVKANSDEGSVDYSDTDSNNEIDWCSNTTNTDKKILSEQQDLADITNTDYLGQKLVDDRVREAGKTRETSEVTDKESHVVANDCNSNMDCDPPVHTTDVESISVGITDPGHVERSEAIKPDQSVSVEMEVLSGTRLDSSKDTIDSLLQERGSREMDNSAPDANIRSFDNNQLTSSAKDPDDMVQVTAMDVEDMVPSTSTVGTSQQNVPVIPTHSFQKESCCSSVDESLTNNSESTQNAIQNMSVMQTSGIKLQDDELLHGNTLQNVEVTIKTRNLEDNENNSVVPVVDGNFAGLSETGVSLDDIDELLGEKDMFWL